jgi:hypothetical protein
VSERFADGEHSFLELSDQWEYLTKFAFAKSGNIELVLKFKRPDSEVNNLNRWKLVPIMTNFYLFSLDLVALAGIETAPFVTPQKIKNIGLNENLTRKLYCENMILPKITPHH